MAWKLGQAFVEFFVKDGKFRSGLSRVDASLKKIQVGMRRTSAIARNMLLAMGAAAIGGIKAYADFEKQMAMVSTMLSGKDVKWMKVFTKGIKSLSKEFGEGTAVLAKGMYDILSASIPPAKALGVLRIATEAAKGGFTDTAVAVDGITSLLNAYGLSAAYAGEVSDKMFATVNKGKITFAELAGNIGKVAPLAKAAGVSMNTLLGSLANLTRKGVKTEQAMTQLRATLTYAAKEGKTFSQVINEFSGKSLEDIIAKGVPQESAAGIAALSANIKELEGDIDSLASSGGARLEAFAKYQKTFAFQWGQAKQQIIAVARELGLALIPAVSKALKSLTKFADKISSLSEAEFKNLIENAKLLGKVLIGIWIAPKLIGGIRILITMIGGIGNAISKTAGITKLSAGVMATAIVAGVGLIIAEYAKLKMAMFKYRMESIRVMDDHNAVISLLDEMASAANDYEKAFKANDDSGKLDALEKAKIAAETLSDIQKRAALERLGEAEEYKDELSSGLEKAWRAYRRIGAVFAGTYEEERGVVSDIKERIKLKEEEASRDERQARNRAHQANLIDKQIARLKKLTEEKAKQKKIDEGALGNLASGEEKKATADNEAKHQKKLNAEISRLKIAQLKDEATRKRKLLDLEKAEEIAAAEAAGLTIAKIKEKYALRSQMIDSAVDGKTQQVQFVGLREMYQKLATAGEKNLNKDILRTNQEQVRLLKSIDENIQGPPRGGGPTVRMKP